MYCTCVLTTVHVCMYMDMYMHMYMCTCICMCMCMDMPWVMSVTMSMQRQQDDIDNRRYRSQIKARECVQSPPHIIQIIMIFLLRIHAPCLPLWASL